MSEQPLSDVELAELHALALLHGAPASTTTVDDPLNVQPPVSNEFVEAGAELFDEPVTGPSGAVAIAAHVAARTEVEGSTEPVVHPPVHSDVKPDPKMGPSGAANIRAFLEAKQAEADAKAAAG